MTGFLDTTASVVSVHQGLQQHDSATTLDLPGHSKGVHAKPPMLDQQTLREYGMLAKRAGSITSTLASRETSPERGSIASFRITSRPGTASGYDAANVKKMYLAGPRSFTPSNSPRPGLETGDVVALLLEDQAYKVTQAEGLEEEPGKTNYVFQPTHSSDLLSDKATHLEVVRQGNWIGFRSAVAEDKFLQSRRHGRQKLAFFNSNFGTWEQWEMVAGDPKQAWNMLRMGLRNRRLPQLVLTVDIARVGTYAMLPNTKITPSSLIPLEGDVSENEELMKMSGLMIYEWFHFVDKEKQVRIRIDGKVNQMVSDAANLKAWTISEINAIRSEMDIEVNRLVAIIHKKNGDLTELETKLVKRLRWGIVVLQTKNENIVRRQVLQWWRKVAEHQHSCAYKVTRHLQRRNQVQQTTAFLVWQQYCQRCQQMRAGMQQLRCRAASAKLAAAFTAWSRRAAASAEAKALMWEVQQQAIWRLQRWRVGCFLWHWHSHTDSCKAGRQRLDSLHAHTQQRRQVRAFAAWRERAGQVTMLLHMGNTLAAQVQRRRAQSWLHAWHQQCLQQRRQLQLLLRAVARTAKTRLVHAFQAWREYVADFRMRKEALTMRWAKEVHYMQRRVLYKWRFAVADARRLYHAGQQIQHRSALRTVWCSFSAWRVYVQRRTFCQRAVSKALLRRDHEQISTCFRTWQQYTGQQARKSQLAAQHMQQLQHGILRGVLLQWHQYSVKQKANRIKIQRCRSTYTTSMLYRGLQAFFASVQLAKEQEAAVLVMCKQSKERQLEYAFYSWQEYVQIDCAQSQHIAAQAAQRKAHRCMASVFSAWVKLDHQRQNDLQAIDYCRRRATQRKLQNIWHTWRQASQHRAHVHQYLAISILRICHRATGTAFAQWKEYVQASRALRDQQEQAVKHMQSVRLRHALLAWTHQTRHRQQLQVVAAHIVLRSSQSTAATVFQAWRHRLADKTAARATIQRVVNRLQSVRTFQAFSAWQAAVQQRQARRAQLEKLTVRLQRLRCSLVVHGWQQHVAQKQTVQVWLNKTARRKAQSSIAAVFGSWHSYSLDLQDARGQAEVMMARNARNLVINSFRAWQHDAAHSQRVLQAAHDMMARTLHASQAAAFDGWAEAVQVVRHKRQVAQHAVRRITNIRLSQAFTRWREQTEALQHARDLALRMAAHMRNQALAAAFTTWAEAVQHQQSESSRREQLADAAVSSAQTALVSHCFEMWREGALEQASGREQACIKLQRVAVSQQYKNCTLAGIGLLSANAHQARIAAAMAAWSHAIEVQQRHGRLVERHNRRRAAGVVLSSLRAWRDLTQLGHQRRVALLRFVNKGVLKRKREAFSRWYAVWQERCQALERLRACITRKRISFRLFKSWYWQTFDDDMQATLGHMFNTTEEAISSPQPSQEDSLAPYSPTARQESMQGFLPLPSHMSHHMPDLNSLYDSPAGGASEILVLEGRDGSHVNLTQSRFSRFASETSGSLNPFELTSRAFRSSGADHLPQLSKHVSAPAQQASAAVAASHASGLSTDSELISTAFRQSSSGAADRLANQALRQRSNVDAYESALRASRQHGSINADGASHNVLSQAGGTNANSSAQKAFRQSSSIAVDGTAQTAAALEAITARQQHSRLQPSYGSYQSLHMSSQASAGLPATSRDEVSSYRHPQQQHSSFDIVPAGYQESQDMVNIHSEVAGSTSHTPESAPVGALHQRYQESPSSHYGGQDASGSPDWQGSWAGLDDSIAGSTHSPGQDSLHSYVESTPAKPAVGFESGTPEHKKLASNFARLASAAALARSPGLAAVDTSAAAPQLSARLSNPEMRTPRTFFNPSFDSHHDTVSP